jgi:1-aminocyclopropane-1-carboxylate deaminase/D-cysteine desulfhydrase-like pyridoxal-dependent ACC family enzyme
MLAGSEHYYWQQAAELVKAFQRQYGTQALDARGLAPTAAREPQHLESISELRRLLPLRWTQRRTPRPFGKVLPGEIERCANVARRHGILLDPIWTLSSWEAALEATQSGDCRVAMLMTGGGLGLHGVAQRWPEDF